MAERPTADIGASASAASGGRNLADGGELDPAQRESWRLDTLGEYRIMDTEAEPGFDRVTKLVADLFDVPIAMSRSSTTADNGSSQRAGWRSPKCRAMRACASSSSPTISRWS